jgi:hypothetical protein
MKFIPEKHNVRWWISRSSLNRPNPSPLGGQDITHNHARGSSTTKPTGRNLRHEMPTESQNERWRFGDFTSPNDHTRSTRVDTFPRHFLHSIFTAAHGETINQHPSSNARNAIEHDNHTEFGRVEDWTVRTVASISLLIAASSTEMEIGTRG